LYNKIVVENMHSINKHITPAASEIKISYMHDMLATLKKIINSKTNSYKNVLVKTSRCTARELKQWGQFVVRVYEGFQQFFSKKLQANS